MSDEQYSTSRRMLLRAGALATAVSTAGCTVDIAGYEISIGEGGDGSGGGGETPTPSYGYGGTPTATSGSRGTSSPTDAPEDGDTQTPAASDEYGLQRYGEHGYGGVTR